MAFAGRGFLVEPVPVAASNAAQLFLPAFYRNHKASCTTIGSKPFHPAPLPEKRPVRVLAGEGQPTVGPPEQVLLLIVHEGGISPALPPALHLEIVESAGSAPAQLGLPAVLKPSHPRIVPAREKASTEDWRLAASHVSMVGVEGGLCNKNLLHKRSRLAFGPGCIGPCRLAAF